MGSGIRSAHPERSTGHPPSPVPKCEGQGPHAANMQFSEIVATRQGCGTLGLSWGAKNDSGLPATKLSSSSSQGSSQRNATMTRASRSSLMSLCSPSSTDVPSASTWLPKPTPGSVLP